MRCPLLLGHPQDAARVPRRAVLSSSPPVRQESPIAPIIEGTKKRDSETLPPRVLVAGRLQCGAARAGVRRGHGECAVLAHLAPGSSKNVIARHAENGGRYLVRWGKIRFSQTLSHRAKHLWP